MVPSLGTWAEKQETQAQNSETNHLNNPTVAQKTVPMFYCFGNINLAQNKYIMSSWLSNEP